jgi:hypothetical protein
MAPQMTGRIARLGCLALALTCGCVRLGYDAQTSPAKPTPDASREDGGLRDKDAGGSDAAMHMDSGSRDAGMKDAGSKLDAAMDSGSVKDSGGTPDDGSMPKPEDGGMDSGSSDSGSDASTDAGIEDAAMQDADVDSGITKDFCPSRTDAVLCDDFEDPMLGNWEYSIFTNGSATYTTSRKHQGSGSLYASITAASIRNSEARRGSKAFPHVKTGDIWVRYYYYVPSSVSINKGVSTVAVAEVEEPYFGFSLILRPSGIDIGSGDVMYSSSTTFPRDAWVCVELHVKIDPNVGFFEAYLDGTLIKNSGAINTQPAMGYSSVDVGIHYAPPPQNAAQAYVDDIVAGYQRYGCN